MRSRLNDSLKTAMKAGDKSRVSTLRLINAAIQERDIAAGAKGKGDIGETEIIDVMAKMIKQRRESIAIFESAGRTELADKEKAEIAVIEDYLPKQLSADETRAAVAAVVAEVGASSVKEMGKVMGVLKQRYAGTMDFSKAGGIVKEFLK